MVLNLHICQAFVNIFYVAKYALFRLAVPSLLAHYETNNYITALRCLMWLSWISPNPRHKQYSRQT